MLHDSENAVDFASEVEAWKRIGEAFDIAVQALFEFVLDDRTHVCTAYLPTFGGARGTLVRCGRPDVQFMNDAQQAGFGFSHVDLTSWPRGERYIVEMLSDWGFSGPGEAPSWIVQLHDHHGHHHH